MTTSSAHISSSLSDEGASSQLAGRLRLAGATTAAATVMLALGAVAISLYFGSGEVGNVFGPISDVLFAAFMLLLIPAVLAVRSLGADAGGAWLTPLSGVAIATMIVTAAGQLLLVVGVIDLATSFVAFGIGLAGFMAWGVALAVLALRHGVLPRPVGIWPLVAVVLCLVAPVAWFGLPTEAGYAAALLLGVAVFGWLIALARALHRIA